MVHRSIVGSMERAVAHLIERHGGAFPDWLAPEQLVVLPVTDALLQPAAAVARQAAELRLRARIAGPELGTLGSRIRSSRLVPYQAVIGERKPPPARSPSGCGTGAGSRRYPQPQR
jgi:threonyl-tRNA synthetase